MGRDFCTSVEVAVRIELADAARPSDLDAALPSTAAEPVPDGDIKSVCCAMAVCRPPIEYDVVISPFMTTMAVPVAACANVTPDTTIEELASTNCDPTHIADIPGAACRVAVMPRNVAICAGGTVATDGIS